MNLVKILAVLLLLLCGVSVQNARADWTKQKSNTLAWLRDVYFLNERVGWIVGSGGTFLATIDGGATWTQNNNFSRDNFRQVYFSDALNGWLLGENDAFAPGKDAPSYLLKTIDGGANWERVEINNPQRRRITKIFFTKHEAGVAVGENGAMFAVDDEKKEWKPQTSPVRYLLFDGVFNGERGGVVVGAGGSILFTEDSGQNWTKAAVFGAADAKLNAVFFINQRDGWTVGANGAIFQTFNGGKIWREQQSHVSADLKSVCFRSTADGWAVGNDATILHTTTAGNVWTRVATDARHNLEKVTFAGKKGWAVGFGGTILSYDE